MKRIAVLGDIHGCIDELTELYDRLSHESLDAIWTTGDLVDRGPDSGAVIDFCIKHGIRSTLGNHEHTTLSKWKAYQRGLVFKNPDKMRTLKQLNEKHVAWIESLPLLHCVDELNLVLVHGGLWPIPIYAQPLNVIRAQMIINPAHVKSLNIGRCKWWGPDAVKMGYTENGLRRQGWHRWYEIYNLKEDVIYGHSVFTKPFVHQLPGCGRTVGIDTGSCFGGPLTGIVISENWIEKTISIPPKAVYAFKIEATE